MEALHSPVERPYISDLINIGQTLQQWIELSAHENIIDSSELPEIMNVSGDIITELESVCSVDNLTVENEPEKYIPPSSKRVKDCPFYVMPKEHNLVSLKIKDEINARREKSNSYRQYLNIINKYRFFNRDLIAVNPSTSSFVSSRIDEPEVILTVNIYQPYKKDTTSKCSPGLKIEQQFLVLGLQKLTALRDRFNCLSDAAILGDHSENPDLPQDTRAKDIYTSGFFYINGTFYNDMRDPQSRDNSKVIIDWAKNYPDMEIGPFDVKLMDETRFVDLTLRLGYPYVYQHQGNCEHLLVFQDVRLINRDDCQDYSQYPIVQCVSKRRRIVCMVCFTMTARWVTVENARVTADPYYFCDICFRSFNYTKDGEKIGTFKAYPFVDRSALM